MRKAYPYPEIVTGDSWQVNELMPGHTANTDNLNNQMTVPLDTQCVKCGLNHSRMIRRHELGHAKWSPKTMGKLMRGTRAEAIEVLEEIRVNYLMYLNGLGINEPTICIDEIRMITTQLVYNGSISEILLYGLACNWPTNIIDTSHKYYVQGMEEREYRTYSYASNIDVFFRSEEFRTFKAVMAKAITDTQLSPVRQQELQFALNQVHHFFQRLLTKGNSRWNYTEKVSYRKVQKVAEELSLVLDMFMDKPTEVYKQSGGSGGAGGTDGEAGDEGEGNVSDVSGGTGPANALEKRMRQKLIDKMQYNSTSGIGQWGKMTVHNPVMTVNLQGRLQNGRQYRPQMYGYNPKYIHRYCIDKKIFKQKQHVLGGTILIDASGSMNFNGADILEIMQMLPAVTIAMYNGSGVTGDLRIIAKNGMRVDETYLSKHSGRGNVIDGPALQWLASMPERRIWVSDMQVFGAYGDSSGFNLMKDVLNICTRNKIINLQDIDEVKEHAIKLNVL